MLTNAITVWMLSLMTYLTPADRGAATFRVEGWKETTEQREARYSAIASDLYEVLYDPTTVPVYSGPRGRAKTAALMLSIAHFESRFDPDADRGPCHGSKRCDSGRSACMMQVHIGNGRTAEGWTKEDLFADRKKCFAASLNIIKGSWRACPELGRDGTLSVYASGKCNAVGDSRKKVRTASYLLRQWAPLDDAPYVFSMAHASL